MNNTTGFNTNYNWHTITWGLWNISCHSGYFTFIQSVSYTAEEAEGKQEESKREEELSLPADVATTPLPPSQQPGHYTSCQKDWLYMDHCSCLAANRNLIKEHFRREKVSNNQTHPNHCWGTCCSKPILPNVIRHKYNIIIFLLKNAVKREAKETK